MSHYSFKEPSGRSKSPEGFSLLEVLLAVAILSTGIVVIFRSFTSSLASTRFSQDITHACLLAEGILWKAEDKQRCAPESLRTEAGRFTWQGRDFNWSFEPEAVPSSSMDKLAVKVSWSPRSREKPYEMKYTTYAVARRQ